MGKGKVFAVLVLFVLMAGCATTSDFDITKANMDKGLNSCLGKLTKDRLIMLASTPTERVKLADGEIWIYKYRKSVVKTTTTGNGSLLFPLESESKTHDYALDVRLRFDDNGILNSWSYKGNITAFNHPFKDIMCK